MTSSIKSRVPADSVTHKYSRKQKRSALRKQKKVRNAISYAMGKHTNKICINTNDIDKVKILNTSETIVSNLQGKVFSNDVKEPILKKSKKNKKKSKKKNNNTNNKNLAGLEEKGEETSLHFLDSASSLRLAKLQEFVTKELKQTSKNNSDKSKVIQKVPPKGNFIKDKLKLQDLRNEQREDEKEINKYAKLIKLNSQQKKRLCPVFEEHFGDILKDIEEGTTANANSYEDKLCDSDLSNNEDDLEKDLNFVLGEEQNILNSENSNEFSSADNDNKVKDLNTGNVPIGQKEEKTKIGINILHNVSNSVSIKKSEQNLEYYSVKAIQENNGLKQDLTIVNAQKVKKKKKKNKQNMEIESETSKSYSYVSDIENNDIGTCQEIKRVTKTKKQKKIKINSLQELGKNGCITESEKNLEYEKNDVLKQDFIEVNTQIIRERKKKKKKKQLSKREIDSSEVFSIVSDAENIVKGLGQNNKNEEIELVTKIKGSVKSQTGISSEVTAENDYGPTEKYLSTKKKSKSSNKKLEANEFLNSGKNVRKTAKDFFIDEFREQNECNDNFLDDEALEDNDPHDESSSELNDEELAFEAGSTYRPTENKSYQPTINSYFDLYDSSSEDQDTDLDGFIVDDDHIDYDSEESEMDIEDEIQKKLKSHRNKLAKIDGANCTSSNKYKRIREGFLSESPEKSPKKIHSQIKRRRILSDGGDNDYVTSTTDNLNISNINGKETGKLKGKKKICHIQHLSFSDNKENHFDDVGETSDGKCGVTEDSISKQIKGKNKLINDNLNMKLKSSINNSIQTRDVNDHKSLNCKRIKRNRVLSDSLDESPIKAKNSLRKRILSDSIDESNDEASPISNTKCKTKKKALQPEFNICTSLATNQKDREGELIDSTKNNVKALKKNKKLVRFSLQDDEGVRKANNSSSDENAEMQDSTSKNAVTEDIYGRLRDKDGNVLENSISKKDGKYIPPALRKLMEMNVTEQKKEQLADLGKKLKGLLNRLAESNLAGIVSQIEKLYQIFSRNDLNDTLVKLMFEIVVTPVFTPDRLVQEHALLIAVLSANIGTEVGAHILTDFVCRFMDEWNAYTPTISSYEVDSKELENLLLFITQLYNFKVVDVSLIYDVLQHLLEKFDSKAVELILLVLRSVGFTLRKDDPLALKRLITDIKSKSDSAKTQLTDSSFSKVSFMLEILMAIRNNNMNKVPNYDPTHGEHLKSLMKGLIRKGCHSSDLKISLEDIKKSRSCGRWWVVGSAWSGGLIENVLSDENKNIQVGHSISDDYSDSFKKKARKFNLSRPPRINILFAMTEGCEDDLDAFQKLIHLNLTPNQEPEIFNVLLICNEKYKYFNNFYVQLALRLINFKKSFQRTLQFCLWDKFDDLNRLNDKEITNLSAFVANLIAEDGLYLSLFKKLDFTSVDDAIVSFLRKCLINILLNSQGKYIIERAFNRLVEQPKLKLLRQCIKIFIVKFIKPKKIGDNKKKALLDGKVQLVLDILSSSGGVRL